MDCIFQKLKDLPDGRFRYRCTVCKYEISSHNTPQLVRRNCSPKPPGGVGSELKALLKWVEWYLAGECAACSDRAAQLDALGIEWCIDNKPLILDWLRESAREKKIPFVQFAANGILNKAIKNALAKRSAQSRPSPTPLDGLQSQIEFPVLLLEVQSFS